MNFIDPLVRRLEHFVYERVCALSELSRPDRGPVRSEPVTKPG